jgi:deazaflavin-dependent oxidoreductase (nitroreductase family)
VRRRVNRAVVAILRSRAHPVLSRWLLLLGYTGRRTGRRYTIPLLYARDGADLVVVALHPRTQSWWRNLQAPVEVEAFVAGRTITGIGRVVGDEPAARAAYLRARPYARPALRGAREVLFVRVTPRGTASPTP